MIRSQPRRQIGVKNRSPPSSVRGDDTSNGIQAPPVRQPGMVSVYYSPLARVAELADSYRAPSQVLGPRSHTLLLLKNDSSISETFNVPRGRLLSHRTWPE